MKPSINQGEDTMSDETAARGLLGTLGFVPLETEFPGQVFWQSFLDRNSLVRGLPEYEQLVQDRKDKKITKEEFVAEWTILLQKVSVDNGFSQTVVPEME